MHAKNGDITIRQHPETKMKHHENGKRKETINTQKERTLKADITLEKYRVD